MTQHVIQHTRSGERGFTLVELSIVLVIIGLIVGGVLVGQDLIRAAQVRATVSQVEKFNSAVNAFRDKYGQIPGDLSKAVTFGLGTIATENGNGNGLIASTAGNITDSTGEIVYFWKQLSLANMIQGRFSGVQTNCVVEGGALANTCFPRTKLDRGGFSVYNSGGFNQFQIGVANSATTTHTFANNLKPSEAMGIDSKMDDGQPATGAVIARGGTAPDQPAVFAATSTAVNAADQTTCYLGTALTGDYNVRNENTNCQLRLRMN